MTQGDVEVTREWLDGLIAARNDAKSINANQFRYDGYDFLVTYATYLIEYLNNELKKREV